MARRASAVLAAVLGLGWGAVRAGEPQAVMFSEPAGMVLVQAKPNGTVEFETAMARLKEALAASSDPVKRSVAGSLQFFRAKEGLNGNPLYVVLVHPAVAGNDYSLVTLIRENLPEGDKMVRQLTDNIADSINVLNLRPLTGQPTLDMAGATAAPPPADAAPGDPGVIRPRCAKEWPDDFTMRAFCEKQQREAFDKLHKRAMRSGDHALIRAKCTKDWRDDFQMRNFCEEQQLKALAEIKREP